MSSPHDQTDRYLDGVLQHGTSQTDIPDEDAAVLADLIEHYPVVQISPHKKRQLLEKAQAMSNRKQKRVMHWQSLARVAMLLIATGLGAMMTGLAQPQIAALMQHNDPVVQEEVLDNAGVIFDRQPQLADAFGFEYGAHATITDTIEHAPAMRAAGMTWVAHHVRYDPAAESATREAAIEAINTAHDNDLKIMINLQGMPDLLDEQYTKRYAFFAADLAEAGADAIEIWHEANIDREFPAANLATHEAYATLLIETSREASVANPDTIMIAGAPAPTGAENAFPGQVVNDDTFITRMMNFDAYEYVDCVGMHYTEGTVSPLATSGDSRDDYYTRYLPTMIETYRQLIDADLPLCITEIGYYSLEGVDEPQPFFQWAATTSREEQRQWTVEAMEWLSTQMDVPLVFIWHLDYSEDNPHVDGYNLLLTADTE